jgi:hypothetical protein
VGSPSTTSDITATPQEREDARSGSVIEAIAALRRRTGCGLAEAYAAIRRAQDIVYAGCGCIEVTSRGGRIRNRSACIVQGADDHEFLPVKLSAEVPHG